MSYAVSYRTGVDLTKGLVYINEVQVSGCETSKPQHHDRLCGEASPIRKLDNLPQDTAVVL